MHNFQKYSFLKLNQVVIYHVVILKFKVVYGLSGQTNELASFDLAYTKFIYMKTNTMKGVRFYQH